MTYIQGLVVPVNPGQKDTYRDRAATAAPIFV